ncbi:MAG: HAD-IB family phosphatase [Acidimicrobiia bacterium]|nr:HAD-IB family phosphatase [Acidimicrobiia bacterium]
MPFLARLTAWSTVGTVTARATGRARGRPDRDTVKRELIRLAVAGRPEAEVAAEARAHAGAILPRLRPSALERVRWHREAGHELVIVSASLRLYVEHVGRGAGLRRRSRRRARTRRRRRSHRRARRRERARPEKVARLEAWLGARRPRIWAYGDSSGDHELLRRADRPVALTARARRGLAD